MRATPLAHLVRMTAIMQLRLDCMVSASERPSAHIFLYRVLLLIFDPIVDPTAQMLHEIQIPTQKTPSIAFRDRILRMT